MDTHSVESEEVKSRYQEYLALAKKTAAELKQYNLRFFAILSLPMALAILIDFFALITNDPQSLRTASNIGCFGTILLFIVLTLLGGPAYKRFDTKGAEIARTQPGFDKFFTLYRRGYWSKGELSPQHYEKFLSLLSQPAPPEKSNQSRQPQPTVQPKADAPGKIEKNVIAYMETLKEKSDEELLQMIRENDRKKWPDEAFGAMHRILRSRQVSLEKGSQAEPPKEGRDVKQQEAAHPGEKPMAEKAETEEKQPVAPQAETVNPTPGVRDLSAARSPRAGAPEILFAVFRNKEVPGDSRQFADQVVQTIFPQYVGKGLTGMCFEVDPNMPDPIDPDNPTSYHFAFFRLMAMMENAGMGKLEPGVRHNLAWSKFNDGYEGRGFIYVVSPWKSDETPAAKG